MSCQEGTPPEQSVPASFPSLTSWTCSYGSAQTRLHGALSVCVCSLTRRGAELDLGSLDPPWLEAESRFPATARCPRQQGAESQPPDRQASDQDEALAHQLRRREFPHRGRK